MTRRDWCRVGVLARWRWCPICHVNVVRPAARELASPGTRFAVHVLDLAIPVVAIVVAVAALSGVLGATAIGSGIADDAAGVAVILGLLATPVLYVPRELGLFASGTAPAKRLRRTSAFKESGERAGFFTVFFRGWVDRWTSAAVFLLGCLRILFDGDRQAWPDELGSTHVVRPPCGKTPQASNALDAWTSVAGAGVSDGASRIREPERTYGRASKDRWTSPHPDAQRVLVHPSPRGLGREFARL